MNKKRLIIAILFVFFTLGVTSSISIILIQKFIKDRKTYEDNLLEEYTYKIVNTFPHDVSSFTEGFEFYNGYFYESTGLYGKSFLKKIDMKTGRSLQAVSLQKKFFGEGITILNGKIYQLTYKEKTGLIYDIKTFEKIGEFSYQTEGWGLTNDGKNLIMSDGTSYLYFLSPENFKIERIVKVKIKNNEVKNLNELEYVNGEIYANVWQKDEIFIIDPEKGIVKSIIDLSGILSNEELENLDVLNGIAFDKENKRLFITGKYWPKVFEIEIVKK